MQETHKSNIIKKYSKKLLGFIRGKTQTNEDAEDILQEVWYQFSRLTNLDELGNISAWLYAVSRNKITDLYRKKKDDNLEDYAYEDEEGNFEIKDFLLIDESENPEMALFKELFWQELNEALSELPEKQRIVFVENEMEDKTLQQIANEQGENLKTIISRKAYAFKHLRQRLEPLYNEILK
ncbi:MAG: sigma-70 family RNA polymerase sigma factor [Chitinophagales bacterium]|nr:sigma-70 family RNA polymerase sigma factor [Bacteroidota bacterium]MCB9043262.1 sigma-70 family RNA polymerase sigma factor [Chitinophagales bacterium]